MAPATHSTAPGRQKSFWVSGEGGRCVWVVLGL